ncbi:Mss4-like protein [Armillaria novae-zelandiae]|uniref:Mss4-like protein n=1 Tax=Armillaria novae-zelandiae TaxID=153914 RepID=A0AA39PNX1_9AGAR|nr:Mss4-like protein [Armillaria novae-zelandiae]
MPIELKGSCHCGAVKFSLESSTAVPYQLCFCSICRKTAGTGGAINLGGHSSTLKVLQGKEHISVYKAVIDRDTPQERIAASERNFCVKCATMLWLYDETWPELIHPFASAIDTPLEVPKKMVILVAGDRYVCIKMNSKPDYVRLPEGDKEIYDDYGPLSLEEWHKEQNLYAA